MHEKDVAEEIKFDIAIQITLEHVLPQKPKKSTKLGDTIYKNSHCQGIIILFNWLIAFSDARKYF